MDENNGGPVSPTPEEAGPTPDSDDGPSTKKRSRRAVEKKVVSVPIGPRNKAGGETAPPMDSWAWRKYGQKPIKGSPYPRGYYRCSSSKGCPARKQVERSRVDPTLMVVTYSSEHNHPVPIPRNHSGGGGGGAAATRKKKAKKAAAKDEEEEVDRGGRIEADTEEGFEDIIAGETGIVIGGEEFRWFSDVGSPSTSASPTEGSDDTLLYGSIAGCSAAEVAMLLAEEKLGVGEGEGEEEEEDSLFAGLGELPECSVVFRRGSAATASIR